MNHPLSLAITTAVLLALGGGARAGEAVDKTLEAAPGGVVSISNVRGEVRVRGWSRNEVHVKGELDDLAEGLEFTREGDLTRVEVKMPNVQIDSGDGSVLEVQVPAGSRVELRVVSASADVGGVGALQLRSVSGDVTVAGIAGDVDLKTVSGDVQLGGDATAPARLKSVSGDLRLTLASRQLDLSTVSGNAEITLGEFDRLEADAVSGDLKISGTLARMGTVALKTVSGDCGLRLKGKVDARVEVATGPGGGIRNALNDAVPTEEFPVQERLETTVGDGTGSIRATTVSGEIRLARE